MMGKILYTRPKRESSPYADGAFWTFLAMEIRCGKGRQGNRVSNADEKALYNVIGAGLAIVVVYLTSVGHLGRTWYILRGHLQQAYIGYTIRTSPSIVVLFSLTVFPRVQTQGLRQLCDQGSMRTT